jgi:hypothetical protein
VLLALVRQVIEAGSRTHPTMDAPHRLEQRRQESEQRLRRARGLAVQAEERLAEARRVLAESYWVRPHDPGAVC